MLDAHAHLSDEYELLNLNKVNKLIITAKSEGINYIISNSTCLRTIDETIQISNKYENVFLGLGIFPTEFKTQKDLEKIDLLKIKLKTIDIRKTLIGEIGLDFKDNCNKELQIKAFKELLKIAKENDLFVEIHSRFAVKQVLEILEDFKYNKIIMHWFLDSKKYIDRAIKNGYYITIGPKYLYQEDLKNNIKDVPKEKILFESDYPAIVSNITQEPKDVKKIIEKYCKDFNVDFEEMLNIQESNLKIIFPKFFTNHL
jgi:TatD DNase family protein